MTHRPMPLAMPFAMLLAACCVLLAAPSLADTECKKHQRAVLTGDATAPGLDPGYKMTQQLTLTRAAGGGLYGRWMGVRLEAWMKYDRPVDRVGSKKVKLPASQSVPDLGGKGICYYDFTNSNTIHFRCETGLPFDIRSSGVYWAGGNVKIGTASGKTISIDMAMSDLKNPMLATTPMSGTVILGTSLDFQAVATVTQRIPAPPATRLSVTVSPDPPSQEALNSLIVTTSISANSVGAHVQQITKVPEGRRVDILLSGASPTLRMDAAAGITLKVKARHEGCTHSNQVDLREILGTQAVKP